MPLSLAAAAAIVIVGGILVVPPPTVPPIPAKFEDFKVDRMPSPPPNQPPQATQIKVNTLKRSAHAPTVPATTAASSALGDIRLARRASIDVVVPSVEDALARAQRIARENGGTVTALHDAIAQSPDVVNGATLTLLVRAERLDLTLAALGTLGRVTARSIDAEDVGGTIVDDEARLRNLRREEAELRALMQRSASVADIESVEEKLADVRGQIESIEGERAAFRQRVATASIDVGLSEARPAPPPAPWWMFWRRWWR
jgi:hypothetical protein